MSQPPANIEKGGSLLAFVEAQKLELAKVAARGVDLDYFIAVALQAATRNQDLLACTHESFLVALMLSARLGLEPMGPLGHFWLIPRRNKHNSSKFEAVPMIGYKGYLELARRSQLLGKMDAQVIYAGEQFSFDRGTGEVHHPYQFGIDKSDENIIGAYAYAVDKSGTNKVTVVLDRDEIEKRRRVSAAKSGPWQDWYAEMCRKTALRSLCQGGLLPLSRDQALALQSEQRVEDEEDIRPADYSVAAPVHVNVQRPAPRERDGGFQHPGPDPFDAQPEQAAPPAKPAPDPERIKAAEALAAKRKELGYTEQDALAIASKIFDRVVMSPNQLATNELQELATQLDMQGPAQPQRDPGAEG